MYRLDFTSALGTLDLAGADGPQDDDSFWFETLADGFDLGSPEAVKVIRQSMMRDGADSYISHYGNRLPTFFVAVNSSDLLGLHEGEKALTLFTSVRGELAFTPPDDTAYPTVYDVLNVELVATVDDLDWLRPGKKQQVYRVTFECEPWARSADPVTVTFSPATPTITTLDAASSLANWSIITSSPHSGPYSALSLVTHLGDASVRVDYSSAVRVAVTPVTTYVAVDVDTPGSVSIMSADGYGSYGPAATQLQASGFTRLFFVPRTSTVDLRVTHEAGSIGPTYIGGIYGATSIPGSGVLAADVPGSVRTQGVVEVSGAAALGDTMIYADPTMLTYGWQPDEDLTWPYAPEGTYMIYRKDAASNAGGTFTATAGGQTVSTYLAAGAVPNNSWFPVGRVSLGGNRSGLLGSSFSPLTETNTRLFRMAPDTSLTYVRGLSQSRLLIDLPSLDYPRGGVWAGAAGSEVSVLDQTDAWEFPTLSPPVTAFFIRAAGDADAESTATFYVRSHTFNAWGP